MLFVNLLFVQGSTFHLVFFFFSNFLWNLALVEIIPLTLSPICTCLEINSWSVDFVQMQGIVAFFSVCGCVFFLWNLNHCADVLIELLIFSVSCIRNVKKDVNDWKENAQMIGRSMHLSLLWVNKCFKQKTTDLLIEINFLQVKFYAQIVICVKDTVVL